MSDTTYNRTYKGFRGVDFSSSRSDCDPTRFNYLVNMWRDYHSEQGAAVETVPGFRTLFKLGGDTDAKVYGMHYLPGKSPAESGRYIVHAGKKLYSVTMKETVEGEEKKEEYTPTEVYDAMNEARSQSVLFHDRIYLVDGKKYLCLADGGVLQQETNAYVPTTYLDGDPYEQKNMLTDAFREKYTAPSYEESERYHYAIHEEAKTLYYIEDDGNKITIRGGVVQVKEDGTVVRLTPFLSENFDMSGYDGAKILVNDDLVDVDATTFSNEIREFEWFEWFETSAPTTFSVGYATSLNATHYFLWVQTDPQIGPYERYFLGWFSPVGENYRFTGKDYGFTCTLDLDQYAIKTFLEIDTPKADDLAEVRIGGQSVPNSFQSVGDLRNVLVGNPDFTEDYKGTTKDAINGCTLICEFDGRIFLSGNPQLPNSVFYSQRDLTGYNNPFYIGCYNYLNDGTGRTPITAMMTTPTQLIVLKDDVSQGSFIYYHYAQDNPSTNKITADLQPRIYSRENGVPGVGCLGTAVNFSDDPCFLSPKGLEAIGKSQVNLERTLAHRSSHVDARLCNEDLRNAVSCEWDGYLVLLVPGGRAYLADSRQIYTHMGDAQYEWYYLDGIGVWQGQTDRYQFVTDDNNVPTGLSEDIGMPIGYKDGFADDCEILSAPYEGNVYRYVQSEGIAYLVDTIGGDKTGKEQIGGTFKQATALLSVDGRLLFGCEDGTVCMFNTDKRGADFYLPPEAYTFNGRRYRTGCALCSDTCGVTNMSKSTIRGSFALTTKAHPYTMVTCMVRTDSKGWEVVDELYAGRTDMGHIDFRRFKFNPMEEAISIVGEREKRWVEKQLYFYTDCYEGPFGMISATYDYKIAGKVRNR